MCVQMIVMYLQVMECEKNHILVQMAWWVELCVTTLLLTPLGSLLVYTDGKRAVLPCRVHTERNRVVLQ